MIQYSQLKLRIAAVLLGLSSWVFINGVFAELPYLAPRLPEQYSLYAWCTATVQLGNVVPIIHFLLSIKRHSLGRTSYSADVCGVLLVLGVGFISCVVLAYVWNDTVYMSASSKDVSIGLLLCVLFGGAADCLSSVIYWPLISRLDNQTTMKSHFIANKTGILQGISTSNASNYSPCDRLCDHQADSQFDRNSTSESDLIDPIVYGKRENTKNKVKNSFADAYAKEYNDSRQSTTPPSTWLILGETSTALIAAILTWIQSPSGDPDDLVYSPNLFFWMLAGVVLLSSYGAFIVIRATSQTTEIGSYHHIEQFEALSVDSNMPKEHTDDFSESTRSYPQNNRQFYIIQFGISFIENGFLTSVPPLVFRLAHLGDTYTAWGQRLTLFCSCVSLLATSSTIIPSCDYFHRPFQFVSRSVNVRFALFSIIGVTTGAIGLGAVFPTSSLNIGLASLWILVWVSCKTAVVHAKAFEFDSIGSVSPIDTSHHRTLIFRRGGLAIQLGSILGGLTFGLPLALNGY